VRVTCEARPASAGWRDSCKLHGSLTFFVEFFYCPLTFSGLPHCRKHARIVTKRKSSSRGCSAENFLLALLSFSYYPHSPETHSFCFLLLLVSFPSNIESLFISLLIPCWRCIQRPTSRVLVITISFYNEETKEKKHHYPAATQGRP